jgi:hypothetical protein
MNTSRIDLINIGLMLLSCAMAFVLPFELFLFSYAVLGPLHYLTEISWLHKRNYFSMQGRDWSILYGTGLLILFFTFFSELAIWMAGPDVKTISDLYRVSPGMAKAAVWMAQHTTGLTFFAFGSALIMILVRKAQARIGAYMILAVVGYGLSENFGRSNADPRFFYLLFAIFIPTLIHVFLFTAAFMLYGALKSKSKLGLVSVGVLGACAASFFLFRPDSFFQLSEYTRGSYDASFYSLNVEVLRILVPSAVLEEGRLLEHTLISNLVYNSNWGLVITRFIAFAYTYHYLNWFSKTNIIRWHDVPRSWLVSVFLLWGISVALYAYNYRVGLMALYFLSFLHVFLEFPLNWVSFKGIGEELGKAVGRGKAVLRA